MKGDTQMTPQLTRLFLFTALGWLLIIISLNVPIPVIAQIALLIIGIIISCYSLFLIIKRMFTS